MRREINQQPATGGRLGFRVGLLRSWRRLARRAKPFVSLLIAGVILLVGTAAALGAEGGPLDFQVKAAFLVSFPKYVDWPATAFADTNSPITVAVFGDDNVAAEIGNMVERGKIISGHPLALKRITNPEQIGADCQIVFIAGSERQRMPAILERVKGLGILTVGESDEFLEKGGIINLVRRERKIRLQVNLTAAQKADLKISSRLLMVADMVKGKAE